MTEFVLDASALLAMLLAEPGGESVAAFLPRAAMVTVNFSEVVQHYARNGADEPGIRRVLDGLGFERVPFDEELAYDTGLLIAATQRAGLSFGDRACLALARRLKVKAVTADRAWSKVARSVGVAIDVIR